MKYGFFGLWESTGLVARTVFKTAEAGATRPVGSIPTLSRHISADGLMAAEREHDAIGDKAEYKA